MAGLVCSVAKCQASSFQKHGEIVYHGVRVVSNIGSAPADHLAVYGYTDSSVHSMIFKMAPVIVSLLDRERFVVVCDNVALTVIVNDSPKGTEYQATLVSIRRPSGFHITGGTKVFKMKQFTSSLWEDCSLEYFSYSTQDKLVGTKGDLESIVQRPLTACITIPRMAAINCILAETAEDTGITAPQATPKPASTEVSASVASRIPEIAKESVSKLTTAVSGVQADNPMYIAGVKCISVDDLAVLVQSAAVTSDTWELHKQLTVCERELHKIKAESIKDLAVLFDGKFHTKSEYVSGLKDQCLLNQLDLEIQRLRGTVSLRV